ncbi:MAG: Glu/Leu/Phe/Val dehydrogenase dimerization domain-containing protein [Polyangiaceae bacterium]
MELFELAETLEAGRVLLWSDPVSGLRAVAVIDDLRLGPAAGGTRTGRYLDLAAMMREAAGLARAMSHKCALAGLAAGGCKIVVLDRGEAWDRPAAFRRLGRHVAELGGLIHTAGDLGTGPEDLAAMRTGAPFVHADETRLAERVADGVAVCMEACAERRDRGLYGLAVAVQGCGAIGAAVARRLAASGARLSVSDLRPERAAAVARDTGAEVVAPERILEAAVDVVAPCARGGVIDEAVAGRLRAWAVVGAANNILASPSAAVCLHARAILHVPDAIASAGAVIEGIGKEVMGLVDTGPLIARLGVTAGEVLDEAAAEDLPESLVAARKARDRLASC